VSDRTSEGLLLLLAAAAILLLWLRGYLTPYINAITTAVANPPAKTAFNVPGSNPSGSVTATISNP
jgi:hypothetical protein